MPTRLVANEWGVILRHDHDLLELQWLPSTAEKARARRLLIDATQFRHRFGDGVMEWRDAHIIPRYGAAGVRKFAFLMPPGFPDAGKEAIEGPAIFPTKWFVNRRQAFDWLGAP